MPAALLLLAGCGAPADEAVRGGTAGAALERSARSAGLVEDPRRIVPVGLFKAETNRVCIVRSVRGYRIGASVDYGDGQGCTAQGTARGAGTLEIDLGEQCRFEARLEADRLTFPVTVPAACERLCTGRASLAALTVDRLSASASEAAVVRGRAGIVLCGS